MHPCDAGNQCSYANYSLTCTPCDDITASANGLQCVSCPAGRQPNPDRTGCVPCTGNDVSLSGVCSVCVGQAAADHIQCQECPLNQIADPPELGCRCMNGYYNASSPTDSPTNGGELLCYGASEPFDTKYPSRDDRASPSYEGEQTCQPCPAECVDCIYDGFSGRPLLKPGYAAAEGPHWFDSGTRVVFECPINKAACLGEVAAISNASNASRTSQRESTQVTSRATCADGYEDGADGVLCTVCSSGYALDAEGCSKCEDITPASGVVGTSCQIRPCRHAVCRLTICVHLINTSLTCSPEQVSFLRSESLDALPLPSEL